MLMVLYAVRRGPRGPDRARDQAAGSAAPRIENNDAAAVAIKAALIETREQSMSSTLQSERRRFVRVPFDGPARAEPLHAASADPGCYARAGFCSAR
jgi:hypothetical protein